jgi:mono/diheme cytochrome c family protein
MNFLKSALILTLFTGIAGGAVIYSGIYPIGADDQHTPIVFSVLEFARERSVEQASENIEVPNLDDPELLLAGGADYNDMCSSCHLKPGVKSSDMSIGLYPKPPNLAESEAGESHEHGDELSEARKHFWVIKHGIKASGMPAWGLTHDDKRIWAMVAFIQRMPSLTADQYQIITARD